MLTKIEVCGVLQVLLKVFASLFFAVVPGNLQERLSNTLNAGLARPT